MSSENSYAAAVPAPTVQRLPGNAKQLGEGMIIRRVLPTAARRMVGAWCFLDHFGPVDVSGSTGMRVGPHPHIGLQTVTWLYEGEILHRDSLSSLQLIRPGQLNLMTSGRGISHSEESPQPHLPRMHGLQFWIALPDDATQVAPAFEHYPDLPSLEHDGLRCTVLVGRALGMDSPARMHSPVMGLDVEAWRDSDTTLSLDPAFEHAVMLTQGQAQVDDETLTLGELLYLGGQRADLRLKTSPDTRLIVIGGRAFEQPVLMWWNFVGRDKAALKAACQQWNEGQAQFGEVYGYDGARLAAPLPPW